VSALEIRNVPATADLTDADLEAVVGGKDFMIAFASMGGGTGGGYQRRSVGNTGRGSGSRAIAAVHRSVTSNFANAVRGRR
jgi:hypothetical protein